ncbi:hypothetical protein Pmar_PMAR011998, partial [Perkinsus marinus ATCC 50983]
MEAILARRVHDVEAADEYLIKWANEPYSRVSWHSMDVLVNQDGGAAMRIRKFEERHPREIDKNVDFPITTLEQGGPSSGQQQPAAAVDSPRRKRSGSA